MAPRPPRQTAPPPITDDYSAVPFDSEAVAAAADAQGGGLLPGGGIPFPTALGGVRNEVQGQTPVQVPGRWLSPSRSIPGPIQTTKPYATTYQQVIDAIRTSRDPQAITRMQRDLFDAGMYDPDVYETPERGKFVPQPAWGYLDSMTLDALNNAIGYSILRGLTVDEALAESRAVHQTDLARRRQAEEEAREAEQEIYSPQVYFAQTAIENIPDADAVGLIVDSTARELIGREIDPDEKARIVGSVMAQATQLAQARGAVEAGNARGIGEAQGLEYQMQVEAAQAEAAGAGAPGFVPPPGAQVVGEPGGGQTFITGGGVQVFEQVSPEAEAARLVEERFAEEAKKYARTRQLNTLLAMIRQAGAGG